MEKKYGLLKKLTAHKGWKATHDALNSSFYIEEAGSFIGKACETSTNDSLATAGIMITDTCERGALICLGASLAMTVVEAVANFKK